MKNANNYLSTFIGRIIEEKKAEFNPGSFSHFPTENVSILKLVFVEFMHKFKSIAMILDRVDDLVSMLIQVENEYLESGEGSLSLKHYRGICLDVFVGGYFKSNCIYCNR